MIQRESILLVADNTGAKSVKCIHTYKTSPYNSARIGDIICTSIQKVKHSKKITKGSIQYGIVVRTKYPRCRSNGNSVHFSDNAIVLIQSRTNLQSIGTRIFGPIPLELKKHAGYKGIFTGNWFV